MAVREDKVLDWVCSTSVVLTIIVFIIILLSPSKGYEVSIYKSTSLVIWILISVNITACIMLLIREAYQNRDDKWWLIPLIILMANCILVLLMSVLRGYYTVGSDTLMHIGYVKDLSKGIISPLNIYPLIHVIPAFFVRLGMSPILATNLSPLYWYLIYTCSFYWLARIVCQHKSEIIIMTALSALLFLPHGAGLAGTTVAISVFPLTLVLVIRLSRKFNIVNIVMVLILMALLMYLHPLALEVALISLFMACFILAEHRKKFLIVLGCLLVGFIVWQMFYRGNILGGIFSDIIKNFSNIKGLPSLSGMQATQVDGNFSSLVLLFHKFGSELLLGCVAVVSIFFLIARYWKYKRKLDLYLACLFVVINVLWFSAWYLYLSPYNGALVRLMYWAVPASVLLVTPFISWLLRFRFKLVFVVLILIFLLPMSLFSIMNKYPSPFIGVKSGQVTYQEIKGMKWLLDNGNKEVYIVHLNGQRTSRYVAAIKGAEWVRRYRKYYWRPLMEDWGTYTFNYNKYQTMGEYYKEDVYAVVTKQDRCLPTWEKDKLYKIEIDPTATLIYQDCDEFEVYYVRSLVQTNEENIIN